jgi:hypothetical protein
VPPELADAVEIAALLRGGQVHLAHRSSVLSTGDQVVVLVAPAGRSWFLANFAPHSAVAPKAPPARKPKSLP